jgi:filamentous hemagglutinin family protein
MNRIYRTLWSVATQSWQAVPETAKSAGKKSKSSAGGVLASVALGLSLVSGANAQAPPAVNQLPTGGSVARGTATISQTATAQAAAMTVNQSSQRAVVNWNTFNVGSNASVNFVQPNAQAVTLNRVNDSNPSQIFGRISANGQVFLTNANGVYFSPSSSVDVGAFTATTHNITDDNFMSGNYVFERNGATGKIINEGNITAALSGYVALLAPEVQNAGVVVARAGTVAMAAGELITLNVDGAGSLAGITTTPSAIASLVENKLAVLAPDGQIILSAVALDKLQAGMVKNSGSLEANSLVNKGGKIVLEADQIAMDRNSKIVAKGATGGGVVLVGGDWQGSGTLRQATKVTMEAGATIDASATDNGDGGKVVLWSDVHNASSVTQVNGSIKAEAGPNGGDGGKAETSGHVLNVDGIQVSTQAPKGTTGQWLLDPYDVYIMKNKATATETLAAGTYTPGSGVSYIQSSDLNTALGSSNVTVTTGGSSPGTATGNIFVYDGVAYSANNLTLNAWNNIYFYFPVNVTGTGSLALQYGNNGVATANYYVNAPINLPTGGNFSTSLNGSTKLYTVINDLGVQADATSHSGAMTLQGLTSIAPSGSQILGNFVLGSNIDATPTQGWTNTISSYKGFIPIGGKTLGTFFSGILDGLGHQITGLKVEALTNALPAGLFTVVSASTIQNLALVDENISSINSQSTGGLLGQNQAAAGDSLILKNIFTSGTVTGSKVVGGVVGQFTFSSSGSITNISSSSTVTGTTATSSGFVGGILGSYTSNSSAAANSLNFYGTVSGAYAPQTGALIGKASSQVINGYYDSSKNPSPLAWYGSNSTSFSTNVVTGLSTSSLTTQSNFSGLDFVNVWAMGQSYPMPQFMFSNILRVGSSSSSMVYGNTPTLGLTYIGFQGTDTAGAVFSSLPTAATPTNTNVGTQTFFATGGVLNTPGQYTMVYDQATVTITPKPLNVSGLSVTSTKVYDGTTAISGSVTGTAAFLAAEAMGSGTDTDGKPFTGDALTITGTPTASYNSKAVASATTINFSGLTLGGASAGNYTLAPSVAGTITPKVLIPTATTGLTLTTTKTYDGTNTAAVTGSIASGSFGFVTSASATPTDGKFIQGDSVSLVTGGTPTATYSQSNAGSALTITYSYAGTLTGAAASNYSLTPTWTASTTGVINKAPLTVTGTTVASKAYDGTTTATLSGGTLVGVIGSDVVTLASQGGSFSSTTVATGKTVTAADTLGGASAGNYTLTQPTGLTGDITAKVLTVTGSTVTTKIYDGTTVATLTGGTLVGLVGAETVTFAQAGTFASANVGTGIVVTANDSISGTNASHYTLTQPTGLTGAITPKALTVSSTTVTSKAYDGTTAATLTGGTLVGVITGDTVNLTQAGTFSTAAVGTNKTVTATDSIDNSNYTLTQPTALLGTITAKALTVTGTTVTTKTYDRTTSATLSGGTLVGVVTGDTVNLATQVGTFASANAGTGIAVTVADTLGGTSASNYTLTQPTGVTGTITPKALTVTTTVTSKTYDGTTTATFGTGSLVGVLGADVVTLTQAGTFASANAGTGIVVTTSDSISGAAAGNYTLTQPTLTGTITAKALTVTGSTVTSKTYDGTTAATLSGGTLVGVIGSDVVNLTQTGTFSTAAVGTGKAVTATDSVDNTNYTITQPTGLTGTITAKALTVTGTTVTTKTYDKTNAATLSGGTLVGVVGSDVVTLATQVGTFASVNAGTGISVTVADTLGGTSAANYTLTQPTGVTGTITPKALTVTGTTVTSKTYDGTTTATLSGGTLVAGGVIAGDTVTLATQAGTFASANAGTGIVVTAADTLGGASAANYTITQPTLTGTITAKALTVTGTTVTSKTYDGTTTATLNGGSLVGVIGSDVVNLTQAGTFTTASAGASKAVTVTDSIDNSNYTLTQPTGVTGTITPKALTVTGSTVANKTYDGTTTATLSGGSLVGVLSGDTVTLATQTGTFASANAGTGIAITAADTLGGASAGNYTLTQPTGLTANITPKALTVTGTSVTSKVYDQTTTATLTGGTLAGVISGDTVTLTQSGTFASANAGTGIAVTVNDSINNSNYTLTQPTGLTGTITAKALTVTTTVNNKTYDGTTTATFGSGNLNGVISGDTVNLTQAGTFASASVGTGKAITVNDTIDNSNYTLTQPTGLTANITAKALTVTGTTVASKTYDGTTAATLSSGTLSGIVGSDVVTLTQAGTFSQSNVGTGLTVTVADTLGGTNAGNYTLTQPTGLTGDITPKALGLSIPGATRVYNGTTTITPSGAVTLIGVVGSDAVTLNGGGTVTGYVDKNVGTNKTVTFTNLTLSGAAALNYTLPVNPTSNANITPASLTITGITAADKTYDGSTATTLSTTNMVTTGLIGSDVVTVSVTGNFASKDAGTGKTVNLTSSFSGTDAGNYTIAGQSTTTAAIAKAALTVSGTTVASKTYDRTTTASLSGGSLVGVVSGDVVTLTEAGTFATANAGTGLTVTAADTLGGAGAGNYILTQPTGLTADITAKVLTVTGTSVASKVYDRTTTATVSGGTLSGVVTGDTLTLVQAGTFSQANVGTGLTVTVNDSVTGTPATNYTLTQPTGFTANITPKALTVTGATVASKTYDGTNTATFTAGTLSGVISGDTVTLTQAGTFASASVGTGKVVTANDTIDNSNYTLTQPTGLTANITAKTLTVTGTTVASKTYDGTTAATLSGGSLVGVVGSDTVTLTQAGTFSQASVGTGLTVTINDSISGNSNYTLTQPASLTADITPKALGLSIPGATRMYNGTTSISPSGAVTLIGVVGSDAVSLTGGGTVTGYVDKNVGTNKTVIYTSLSLTGAAALNYTLPVNPTSNANITAAPLAITGITAADKTYDGGTTATVSTASVATTGLIAGDVVTVAATGSFADKNAGSGKTVNLTSSYSGADVGNYTITDQATTTASIAKAPLTVTADNITRNIGATTPALTTSLSGFVGGETLATSGVTGAGLATTTATPTTEGASVITAGVGTLAASNYSFPNLVNGTLTVRAIAVLNNSEVTTLIGSQLANLTGQQMASFSTTQLTVFSWQHFASLTAAQFAGLTAEQLGSLNATQLYGLTAAQLALMTPLQLGGLSSSQLASLSNTQLQALTATQVSAISTAQLSQMTPAQIALLTGNPATPLSLQQMLALTPAQVGAMSTVQVARLTAAELSSFSDVQLSALSLNQLASLSPASFSALSSEQIMALSLTQVVSLTPDQLRGLTPTQIASLSADEVASFDALQLAAIGIFPKVDTPVTPVEAVAAAPTKPEETAKFEAAIPVMIEVAAPSAPAVEVAAPAPVAAPVAVLAPAPVAVAAASPTPAPAEPAPAVASTAQATPVTAPADTQARAGVLPVTVLSSANARPNTTGLAFEQDDNGVSLHVTAAPPTPPVSAKLVFNDKLTTFMVAQDNGKMVEFQGGLINKRLVIVAPSAAAKQIARSEMNMVLAAAITSLGAENRVVLANLSGVVIDLR